MCGAVAVCLLITEVNRGAFVLKIFCREAIHLSGLVYGLFLFQS